MIESEENPILFPPVLSEDVDQEAELVRLSGKIPNRSIIRKRLEGKTQLAYDFTVEVDASEINWFSYAPDPEIIFKLAQWALAQSADLRSQIFGFLEDPTEAKVETLIQKLISRAVITHEPPKLKEVPLSILIIKILYIPRTIEEIYQLEKLLTSKRPRAAIRQTLRRLISQGKVTEAENGLYCTTNRYSRRSS